MVSLFSEKTGYVSIGDEYDKKEPLDPRNVGLRGFVAQPGKKGNLPQATFDWKLRGQFIGLNEGDKYIDPGLLDREKQRESKEMCISKDPFRYTSYPQQSCGLGGYEGCFQKNVQHETEYDVTKKGELPVKTEGVPRNCVTNPSKKGTYGTPGTLLSNSMGGVNAGWAGLEYVCDPYDAPKRLEQKQKHLEKERIGDKVPFVVGTKRRAFFDETATSGSSSVYRLTKPLAPHKPPADTAPPEKKDDPWKPNHQGKAGISGLFGMDERQFPPYREDPFEIREQKEKDEREKDRPKFGTWKPVSVSRTLTTRSIEFGPRFYASGGKC